MHFDEHCPAQSSPTLDAFENFKLDDLRPRDSPSCELQSTICKQQSSALEEGRNFIFAGLLYLALRVIEAWILLCFLSIANGSSLFLELGDTPIPPCIQGETVLPSDGHGVLPLTILSDM
jgi:hypothetical protein